MSRDVGVILVAGGKGQRLGGAVSKQFLPLAGQPMLLRAMRAFTSHPAVVHLAVVLPPPVLVAPPEWLSELPGERISLVAGGRERMDSVENGLLALPPGCAIALSHDAARPFVSREVIDAVIALARRGMGGLAALPVGDTLKSERFTDGARVVDATVSREGMWRAQTPQGFPRALLERAFREAREAGFVGTDESALVERTGIAVVFVPDSIRNFKVTTADDLALAEVIARELG